MDYMTLKEAAEKWGVTPRRVNYYCAGERIPGAMKMAGVWLIPKNAEKPIDGRTKQGRLLKHEQRFDYVFDIMELDYLRAINSSLFFINKLRNVNSSKLKDSDELTIKVWGEYSKQVNKLIDNLHDLIIKWNCDGLTNIKLK